MSRFEPDPPSAAAEERELERLLTAAGPRPPLPEAELAAAHAAARRAWREHGVEESVPPAPARTFRRARSPQSTRRSVPRWALAAAAVLAVAVGTFVYRGATRAPRPAPPVAPVLAAVELVDGAARVRLPAASGFAPARPLAAGERLPAGAVLLTDRPHDAQDDGRGRLTLRLGGGASLRVDSDSEVTLAAVDRIDLVRGRIYLDSDPVAGGHAPAVGTPVGRFVDLGTQYEVAIDAESGGARLRVREGRVELRDGRLRQGRRLEAAAGEELAIAKDGAAVRAPFPRSGPEWAWVVASAPMPEIDGWTLARFLDWLARESGLAVDFADRSSAERAATVTVHGSVRQLEPFAAAEVVLASAGCSFTVEGDRLVVRAER